MTEVKLSGFAPEAWSTALKIARTFTQDYPDSIGIRNGVVYDCGDVVVYAYRTKTLVVVRHI